MDASRLGKAPVQYRFEWAEGPSSWRVLHFDCEQRVNACYRAQLLLVGEENVGDPSAMMGQRVSVHVSQGPQLQAFGGVVEELEIVGQVHGHLVLRLYFVPALALCQQSKGARVFQAQSTLAVVQELLGATLKAYGSAVDQGDTERGQEILDFRVQYDESDLDFAQRLLAEAGLNYVLRYDHEKEAEIMVLFDRLHACPRARNHDAGDNFAYHPVPGELGADTIQAFGLRQRWVSSSASGLRWDWRLPMGHTHQASSASAHSELCSYDPKQYREGQEELARRVKDQSLRQASQAKRARGESQALGLELGSSFVLHEHPNEALNARYVLVQVHHRGCCLDLGLSYDDLHRWVTRGPRYQNHFSCIPEEGSLLPDLCGKKQRVPGLMTALVCGPKPGQVHVDEQGRIQLRFHWDLDTPKQAAGSCWVRVAQGWTGDGFGLNFIPRVGTEVVVEFVQGDLEQPLVTGCVPNQATRSPFSLPRHKHQSGLRTQSSDGGFHELRFDDQRGQEEVYLRAQRAFKVEVVGDKVHLVTGDHLQLHEANEQLEVLGDRSLYVGGAQKSETVGPQFALYRDSLVQEVGPKGWSCKSQGEMQFESEGAQRLRAKEGFELLSTKGGAELELRDKFRLEASEVKIQCGSTTLRIDAKGAVSLQAKGQPVSIQGSKIKLNSK